MKETVKVELLKDPECLMGFSCGEPSIDELIKKAYYETLLEKGYTYVAILNDRVIAVYQIAFITLSAEEISEDTNDHNWSGNSELRYGCLLIHYLAVEKTCQHRKIGSTILNGILKEISLLGRKWPVRFIIIDAVNDLVSWYKSFGFEPIRQWQLKMLVLQRECIMTVITMIGPNWNGMKRPVSMILYKNETKEGSLCVM